MEQSVSAAYVHRGKQVAPGRLLTVGARRFKWYGIFAAELAVPDAVETQARAFVAQTDLSQASDLGFVVLHRCGADFYFLIVCSWRGNNEIWQSVYAKDRGDADFRDWPRPAPHLPTYCVWEMSAVAHESGAWQRYLLSPRDAAARAAWLEDRYEGPI
jgi:hypothetical protein